MLTKNNIRKIMKDIISISFFCLVIRDSDFGGREILVVQDDPDKKGREWKDQKSKLPGDTTRFPIKKSFTGLTKSKLFLETGVKAIFLSKLINGEREYFHHIKLSRHVVLFYLMKYVGGELRRGGDVGKVEFIHEDKIKKMMEEGQFLSRHQEALEVYFALPR